MATTQEKPMALITGASTGIGLEFAKIFAREGYGLILVARSRERLETAASELKKRFSVAIHVIPSDLADPAAPKALYDEVKKRGLDVEVLVNNAGYGDFGSFLETDLEKELQMMQLNMVTLAHLT